MMNSYVKAKSETAKLGVYTEVKASVAEKQVTINKASKAKSKGKRKAATRCEVKVKTYNNAVKFKITDVKLIGYLDYIHEIFLNEYELINHQNIQPSCFTKKELSHEFRGHFTEKLAELINKNYLKWDLNNRAKYFRMFSLHLRQDFKSLDYKQKIVQVLEKYDFNIQKTDVKKKIQEELAQLNLYPTKQEIMNICRWHSNANKRNIVCSSEAERSNKDKIIPLDFTLGQDKQTILQPNEKEPVFHINFNGNWVWLNFIDKINKLQLRYFKNKIDKENFVRFTKPKFVFNHEQNCWFIILTIESKVESQDSVDFSESNDSNNSDKSTGVTPITVAGVDIGQVKPYSAVLLDITLNEQNIVENAKLASRELVCSKETKRINEKLGEVKYHLSNVYRKLNVYAGIIKNNKNPEFTHQILKKQELLINEKCCLRRKRKELQKRKSYLAVRDLIRQLNFFKVKKVNIERLNWVENTGGSWDFSQQQEILKQKAIEFGIEVTKVYAANTSKENPFTKKRLLGKPNPKTRMVEFSGRKYKIDRDILGAINVALRTKMTTEKQMNIKLNFNENKRILKGLMEHGKHRI